MDKRDFRVVGRLLQCGICKRSIMVEDVLIGVPHTLSTIVTCWDCLDQERKNRAKELYSIQTE